MSKTRLEAFSDGVLSIIITIMVLNLKIPQAADIAILAESIPTLISYMLSFVFIGIYWNNHHHMLQTVHHVNGAVLWANLHLLFWLSLIPWATGWLGNQGLAVWPVALYGFILLMAAMAYYMMSHLLMRLHGHNSTLSKAYGRDLKGKISLLIYLIAIPAAFIQPGLSLMCYLIVAAIWIIPDRRVEKALED